MATAFTRNPPRPTVGIPTLGWGDHRPFLGAPTFSPAERLARVRADGSMEPVPLGSLTGVPRIYAAVHGWAPGSQSAADLIHARTGNEPRAWDDGMVDLFGFSIADSFIPLLSAIAAHDPDAAVLWFSWVDESATAGEVFAGAESLKHTHINGARLAHALVGACSRDLPPVQLIGHSHGGVVATNAALSLPSAPAQLTLLDCPEDWFSRVGGSAGLLAQILPRLEPGRDPGQVFVDSYTSMFGRPYHRHAGLSEVVDVRLAGGLRRRDSRGAVGDAHEYALEWYTATAQSDDPKCGFGWSVLAAKRAAEAGDADTGFDPQDLAAGYLVGGQRAPLTVNRRPPVPTQPRHETVPLDVDELELTAERPDASISVTLSETDLVDFDYQVSRAAPRTRVEGAVERVLAFSGPAGEFEVPSWGRYLRISGNRDASFPVMVHFRLVESAPDSAATITGLSAVRTGSRTRNYDSTSTALTVGLTGAVVGSVGTLAVQGAARTVRRWLTGR